MRRMVAMAMFLSGHAGFADDDGSTILPSMRRSPHLEDGFSESFQTPILYHSLRRMLSQYSTHSLGTSTVVARSIRPLPAFVREAMHLLTSRGLARNLSHSLLSMIDTFPTGRGSYPQPQNLLSYHDNTRLSSFATSSAPTLGVVPRKVLQARRHLGTQTRIRHWLEFQ